VAGNPTQGQIIHELVQSSARHDARLEELRDTIGEIKDETTTLSTTLADLQTQVAVNEALLNEARKSLEEAGRRWYALLPPIVGGIIGALLTLLISLIINALKAP
jgi:septal ring factor EnvC (AmiA/AmiB activator)